MTDGTKVYPGRSTGPAPVDAAAAARARPSAWSESLSTARASILLPQSAPCRRVRFVGLYYWPDDGAVPRMLTDLAEDCAGAGLEVEVVTGRGSYRRLEQTRLAREEIHRGVRIRRLPATSLGRGNVLARLADYVSFAASALLYLLLAHPADVTVVVSSPPLLPLVGALARRIRGGRLIYKVEDLYPDLALALGLIREGWVARTAAAAARAVVRTADAVVAIDTHMVERLRVAGARGRLEVIGNWADVAEYRAEAEEVARLREELGLGGRFVVLYSGNFGLAHAFDAVLAAAARLAGERPEVVFVFVGDGPRRQALAQAAARLANVRLLPFQTRPRMAAMHALADVVLVTLRPEADGLVMPSKLYGALAASRPVLFVGGERNDGARLVRRHRLGWVVPDAVEPVVAALREAAGGGAAELRRGQRIPGVFEREFQRDRLTARWVELLDRMVLEAGAAGLPARGRV